jgi:hypothetical protein
MMTKDELLHKASELLLADERLTPDGWVRLVVFARISESQRGVNALVYTADRKHKSLSPSTPQARDVLVQLREQMADEDPHKRKWVVAVLQFDAHGDDVEMNARFEYEDIDRWAITPSTMKQVIDEFRPEAG